MPFKAITYAITHTFDFNGYENRTYYWVWALTYAVVAFLIAIFESAVNITWLGTVYWLLLLITNLSSITRRLRDAGFDFRDTYSISVLMFFIPIIGQILLLKWLLTSSATPNMYAMSTVEYNMLRTEGHT